MRISEPPSRPGAADSANVVLSYDDNRLVGDLFGQFDQNLALIEQRLGVEATPRGNHVALRGSPEACAQAKRV